MRMIVVALLVWVASCEVALGEYWYCLGKVLQDSDFVAQVQELTREGGVRQQRLARIYWEDERLERPSSLKSVRPWFLGNHAAKGDPVRTLFIFYGQGQHLMTLEAENGVIRYPGASAEPPSDEGCVFSGSIIEFHDLLMRARYLRQRGIPINGNLMPTVFGVASVRESLCADLSKLSWRDLLEAVHATLELEVQYPAIGDPLAVVPLRARCAVLRYPHHHEESLAEVQAISEPFHASLAIGAMAAQTIKGDADQARKLLREAEETALRIDHWSGSDATSLGYLFQVIPMFPEGHIDPLLLVSRQNLMQWKADGTQKAHPMRVFAEVTIQADPTEAGSLLLDVTQYGNHCWESARTIGRFLARESPDEAWKTVEKMALESSTVFTYLAASVLAEIAMDDVAGAFKRLDTLPECKRLTVGVRLGYFLFEEEHRDKTRAVVDYLVPLSKKTGQFENSVSALRTRLEAGTSSEQDVSCFEADADDIARFLKAHDMNEFQRIVKSRRIVFADRAQAIAFVASGLSFARQLEGASPFCTLKGGAWSDYGFLARVAAAAGDVEQTFRACHGVRDISARLALLLETYELANPLPPVLHDWPLGFREEGKVTVSFTDNAE